MIDFTFLPRDVLDLIRREIATELQRRGFVGSTLDASHVGGVLGASGGAPVVVGPGAGGSAADILSDSDGEILVDDDGNVLTGS